MSVEARIRAFVLDELLYDRELPGLAAADPLVGPGLLDSLGVMRLVLWIEEEFGVQIPDEEVVPENLDTLERVVALVERKRGAART